MADEEKKSNEFSMQAYTAVADNTYVDNKRVIAQQYQIEKEIAKIEKPFCSID